MNVCMTLGRYKGMPPFLAVATTEALFAAVGLFLLAKQNGWWWQLKQLWKKALAQAEADQPKEI